MSVKGLSDKWTLTKRRESKLKCDFHRKIIIFNIFNFVEKFLYCKGKLEGVLKIVKIVTFTPLPVLYFYGSFALLLSSV
jgi:hypothetical protein